MIQYHSKILLEATPIQNIQSSTKTKKLNDFTPEEIADIKEHSSSKEKPKHFKNVKELIKDLEND
jgi:hypothetical protein